VIESPSPNRFFFFRLASNWCLQPLFCDETEEGSDGFFLLEPEPSLKSPSLLSLELSSLFEPKEGGEISVDRAEVEEVLLDDLTISEETKGLKGTEGREELEEEVEEAAFRTNFFINTLVIMSFGLVVFTILLILVSLFKVEGFAINLVVEVS